MRSTPNQLAACCNTQHSEGERLYTMNTPLPRSAASDREVSTHVLQLLLVDTTGYTCGFTLAEPKAHSQV